MPQRWPPSAPAAARAREEAMKRSLRARPRGGPARRRPRQAVPGKPFPGRDVGPGRDDDRLFRARVSGPRPARRRVFRSRAAEAVGGKRHASIPYPRAAAPPPTTRSPTCWPAASTIPPSRSDPRRRPPRSTCRPPTGRRSRPAHPTAPWPGCGPRSCSSCRSKGPETLSFPDGRKLRAAYAGDNGKPFVAIARPMVQAGQLKADHASGDNIRSWLRDHKGAEANAVMWKNPRYVFFSLAADDGQEPAGAAGMPLPAGRAIAIDPSQHALRRGLLARRRGPVLAGAFTTYRRLAVALDTGSAIRGQVRGRPLSGPRRRRRGRSRPRAA